MITRLLLAAMCSVLLILCGCGGGGPSIVQNPAQPGVVVPTESYVSISGRVVAPSNADRQFSARMIDGGEEYLDLSGAPLATTTVSVAGSSVAAMTDAMGNFSLSSVPVTGDVVISATKGSLVFYRRIPQPSSNISVNINYQTTAAYLYYENIKDTLPEGVEYSWLERTMISYSSQFSSASGALQNCMKEYGRGQTETAPHENPDFLEQIEPVDDLIPPMIRSFSFSKTTYSSGDTITINAVILDAGDIYDMYAIIQESDYPQDYSPYTYSDELGPVELEIKDDLTALQNGSLHNVTLSGKIPDNFPSGSYFVSRLYIRDSDYNTAYYSGAEEFEDSYTVYYDFDEITINAAVEDTTAPAIISAEVSPETIESSGSYVYLVLTLDDSRSDIVEAGARIVNSEGNSITSRSVSADSMSIDQATGRYSYTFEFYGSYFTSYDPDTYSFEVYAIDSAHNKLYSQLSGATFTSTIEKSIYPGGTGDTDTGLEADSVTLSWLTDSAGPGISFSVVASNDYPNSQITAGINLSYEDAGNVSRMADGTVIKKPRRSLTSAQVELAYNSSTGKWSGEGTTYISDYISNADITVSSIRLRDSRGGYVYFNSSDDDWSEIDINTLTRPQMPRSDTTAPALTGVSISKSSLTREDKLPVSVTVQENGSGLKALSINFACSGCESDLVTSFYGQITRFDYFGDGVWNASFSVPFNDKTAPGSWYLSNISINDFAGNSYYVYKTQIEDLTGNSLDFDIY